MSWITPNSQNTRVTVGANNVFVDETVTIAVSNDTTMQLTDPAGRAIIDGTLISGSAEAFWYHIGVMTTGTAHIDIGATGKIKLFSVAAESAAVTLWGDGFSLTNAGSITSLTNGVLVYDLVANGTDTLTNSGIIDVDGTAAGRWVDFTSSTIRLNNSGTIRGDVASYGIQTVAGGNGGVDIIINTGTMIGAIKLDNFGDVYFGAAIDAADDVSSGAGGDQLTGGTNDDWFEGGTENDMLRGQRGADRLIGDAGNDTIFGGLGHDVMTGGSGNDRFVFDSAKTAANVDTITDFTAADTVLLQNSVFTKLIGTGTLTPGQFWKSATGLAHDANDRIIYETDTGKLFYDSNGNAAGGRAQIGVLTGHPVITNADFFII
jgi:Ca2+-binding RTX toxin-like protein